MRCPPARCALRVVRSPHARARFTLGDLDGAARAHPGLVRGADRRRRAGATASAIFPRCKDQPVLADRHRALSRRGRAARWSAMPQTRARRSRTPKCRSPGPAAAGARSIDACAGAGDAAARHRARTTCCAAGGSCAATSTAALAPAAARAEGDVRDHLRRARLHRARGRLCVRARRRRPHRDRRLHADAVHGPRRDCAHPRRRRRSRCASCRRRSAAASAASSTCRCSRCSRSRRGSSTGRCACVYTRARSRWCRPPSGIRRACAREVGADANGRLTAFDFHGDFNTGAYASWGPTVANRVPMHAHAGPIAVPQRARTDARRATPTARRRRLPRLRRAAGGDRARSADRRSGRQRSASTASEFRRRNALAPRRADGDRAGARGESSACAECLDALRPALDAGAARAPRRSTPRRSAGAHPARRRHRLHVVRHRQHRRSANPSTMRVALRARRARRPLSTARSTSARAPPRSCCRSAPTRSGCRSIAFDT